MKFGMIVERVGQIKMEKTKNHIMKKSLILALIVFVGLSSCVKDEFEQAGSTTESGQLFDFLFKTTSDKTVELTFENQSGGRLKNISFEIYTQNPFHDGTGLTSSVKDRSHKIFRGNSGADGLYSGKFNIPSYVEKLYVVPSYIGLLQYYEVPVSGDFVSFTLAPAIRDGSFKSSDPDGDGNQLPYKSNGSIIPYLTLGNWNPGHGLPYYLDPESDVLTDDFIADINASLPESQPLPMSHPQYLAQNAEPNLVLDEQCEVWVTFVHEGAGWLNSLGYYTYEQGNAPQTVEDIEDRTIIFPNASLQGSGGKLQPGDKVKLKYYNQETEMMTDTFPANIVIGWFLIAHGWDNGSISSTDYIHYSNFNLNQEEDDELKRHNVLLFDAERELFLVGFEDVDRSTSSCDQDFNDAVFYATANPIEAINTTYVPPIDDPEDTDGDGVSDIFDEFPTDPERAYNYYYPSQGDFGTLVFEDLWPSRGDYDFNDLVVDYQYRKVANANNQIVEIVPTYVIRAIGAGFHNGFGISLDVDPEVIGSVSGQHLTNNIATLHANGTETNQEDAVILVFDDAWDVVSNGAPGTFFNTQPGMPAFDPDTINMTIYFASPVDPSVLGLAPYNPFIFVNNDRSKEIHLPGSKPTSKADFSLFGTGDDESDPATGRYYFSSDSYPWAANIPESFDYPAEKVNITEAHLMFGPWASSNGFNYMDWFQDKPGYRNNSKFFSGN